MASERIIPEEDAKVRGSDHARISWLADPSNDATESSSKEVDTAEDGLTRLIYDAQGGEEDAVLVRREGEPLTGDAAVDAAYRNTGITWRMFHECFDWKSYDGQGGPMVSIVHFGEGYENAFWSGQAMIYGDGAKHLQNLTELSVTAHEFTHAVTQHTAGLQYQRQAGALNEHLSDVFGSLAKQYANTQTAADADWLIGEGVFRDPKMGKALRSMKEPDGIEVYDPQPAHYRDYLRTEKDHFGVHTNSGIPNKAFYLAARQIGGYAYEDAGQIWFHTMRNGGLRANCTFREFAYATIRSANTLYGADSPQTGAVRSAWERVGVLKPKLPADEIDLSRGIGIATDGVAKPRAFQTPRVIIDDLPSQAEATTLGHAHERARARNQSGTAVGD